VDIPQSTRGAVKETGIVTTRNFSRRMLTIASMAAISLSLVMTVGVALANNLNQFEDGHNADGISWDDPAFQGTDKDCGGLELDAGQVLWHFVHTGTNGGDLPATLDAEFDNEGPVQADGYSNGNGNGVVMYDIVTDADTLLSASDSIDDDGLLLLSHICSNTEEESVEQSVAESEAESVPESGEQSVEAGTGTPEESTPDGALFGNGSSPLPTIAFSLILLASLGGLAYANVKSVRS
jgi:hypothetical protein